MGAVADAEFTEFVREVEPRLVYALAAVYGFEVGREATADALAHAWEHWSAVQAKDNPVGYLFRGGQSASRRYWRKKPLFPPVPPNGMPEVEPGLPIALASLSPAQRTAVVLLEVLDWSEREAAEMLGLDRSTVRRHRDRGLAKLRAALGVKIDV